MSYLVCHIQKFKSSDVKGLQIHNQRESKNSKNKDIDPTRTPLNIDLHNPHDINYNKQVKQIIEDGYKGSKSVRKDAVVMTSTLISSDSQFFAEMPLERQIEYFNQSYQYLKNRFGEENIVAATIHFDEKTPHMHVCSVPLTGDGKLSAKKVIDRKSLREIQDELPKHLKKQGFDIERGVEGSENKHIEINKFKADTLKKEIQQLSKKSNTLSRSLEARREAISIYDKLDSVKPLKTPTGDFKLSKSDFDLIKNLAKDGEVSRLAYRNLDIQNRRLSAEAKKLREELKFLNEKEKAYEDKIQTLQKENINIKKVARSNIKALEKDVSSLSSKLDKCLKFLKQEKLVPNFNKFLSRVNEIER